VPTHPGWWHLEIEPQTDVILDIPLPATTAEHHLGGTLYIVSPEQFRADPRFVVRGRSLGFVLPPERSIDIDEAPEFVIAEALAAAQAIPPVPFGDRMVGDGSVLVIAEAGVNHDGDVEQAHRLVDAAADTGADAVKFQTFDPTALATSSAPTADYQPGNPYGPESTYRAKSCLDVCPIHMTGVQVTATAAGGPSLALDDGTFSCVVTDVTECR